MARNLDSWQREDTFHIISSRRRLPASQIAKVAECNERSVTNIRKKMRLSGSARAPHVPAGRPSTITEVMLDALCNHIAEKPGLYVEKIAISLRDEFNVLPSSSSIKRALSRAGWTKGKAQ
jgi:transposase